jgi:CubicO group peptidase (beta-lactamase class C family)
MTGTVSMERLARLTDAMDRMTDGTTYAGAVTQIWLRGRLVHESCHGMMDIENAVPMRRDAIFRIASMTKPIVSAAVLQLLEEGKLRLGDDVTRWLPELTAMQVLCSPDAPLSQTEPLARPITVLDLLTHRSGITYDFTSFGELQAAVAPLRGKGIIADMTPDEWMRTLGETPLISQPGATWHYGFSTDVLGVLVSRIDGKPLFDALTDRILGPLGMKDTGFHVGTDRQERFTVAYMRDSEGKLVAHDQPGEDSLYGRPPRFQGGGGGMVATADDYAKFALALLNHGEYEGTRILSRKTVEAMTRDWIAADQRAPHFPVFDILGAHGFGLGVSVVGAGGIDVALNSPGKFGWPGAYSTRWFADPSEDLVAIMMTQMWFDMKREIGPAFDSLVYQALD